MPPHLSSKLASQPENINLPFVYCDQFGLRMTQTLPLESSRSPPAVKPDNTAMLPRRVTNLAMRWVKKWLHLWQNFSGALMKAVLMGIANGVCRLAAAAPLVKARRPWGEKEELGRDESKMEDEETLRCEGDRQGYLILSSLGNWSPEDVESLIEDRHFGECLEFFSDAKMDEMGLEDSAALCLIHHSFSFDSESSSVEGMGLEETECPGSLPQKSAEGLGIGGYFEEKGRGSCSPHEEFGDFENDLEGDSRQSVESPSISQEHRESVECSGDFVMFEEKTSVFSKDGEYLLQYGKAKENLGTPTASYGFKSPLVLSLFYSPSEEDDDDLEDWSSEDEMEETNQSCLEGAVLETGDNSSAAEDNSQHQGVPDNPCGSYFPNMDPLHSLCFSKSTQPASFASPEPKNHKEITASFYIRKEDSKPEELCNLPKPSFPKDQRSTTGHPPHQCNQQETEINGDLVTTEASLGSQKACQMVKKVRFSPEVTVHTLVVWDYAYRAARRGPWEEMARDRCRFQRRIAEVGAILEPCLETEHRAKTWRKIHGNLDLVPQENTKFTLHRAEAVCLNKVVN